jgi:hypothetical protein
MSYNAKNYTEQGGEKTVIGGTLEILEGATVKGLPLPVADNVKESTAGTVSALKDDLNELILNLKEAGIVKNDNFTIDSNLIPNPTDPELVVNHSKVTEITCNNDLITIVVPLKELTAYPSSDPSQGTHKWLGLEIKTGLTSIVGITYNGSYVLNEGDATEAVSVGCSVGSFVLYIKAEEIVEADRVITLSKPGYAGVSITIHIEDNSN